MKNELHELSRHLPPKALKKLKKINYRVEIPSKEEGLANLFTYPVKPQVLLLLDRDEYPVLSEHDDDVDYLFAQNVEEATEVILNNRIDFVVVDLLYGLKNRNFNVLNLDDKASVGIDLFLLLRANVPDLPVYLAKKDNMTAEHIFTFKQKGARGIVDLGRRGGGNNE